MLTDIEAYSDGMDDWQQIASVIVDDGADSWSAEIRRRKVVEVRLLICDVRKHKIVVIV